MCSRNDDTSMIDYHDPLHGIDKGPCKDFAPDTLGDNPNVCTTCYYHKIDHPEFMQLNYCVYGHYEEGNPNLPKCINEMELE